MGLLAKAQEYLVNQNEDNILPIIEKTVPSLFRRAEEVLRKDKLEAQFNSRGDKYSYLVMSENSFANAAEFERVHINLYRNKRKQPSMLKLVDFHVDKLGLDKGSAGYKALWLLSKRAEHKSFISPAYHNQAHFKDVVAVTANFLAINQEVVKKENTDFVRFTKQDMFITIAAAIGHDLNHRGYANPADNKTFNEEESFHVMLPYLRASNMPENDIEKIHTILIATSPNGGNQYVKALTKVKREGRKITHRQLDPENKFPQLKKLINSKKLLQMAAIVADADLYASSGAGLKAHQAMNIALTKEARQVGLKMDFNNNASSNFFFSNIVGEEGYASTIARRVANPSFTKIFNEVKDRIANENKQPVVNKRTLLSFKAG